MENAINFLDSCGLTQRGLPVEKAKLVLAEAREKTEELIPLIHSAADFEEIWGEGSFNSRLFKSLSGDSEAVLRGFKHAVTECASFVGSLLDSYFFDLLEGNEILEQEMLLEETISFLEGIHDEVWRRLLSESGLFAEIHDIDFYHIGHNLVVSMDSGDGSNDLFVPEGSKLTIDQIFDFYGFERSEACIEFRDTNCQLSHDHDEMELTLSLKIDFQDWLRVA